MKNNHCPSCKGVVEGSFDKHLESLGCRIETEINSDPTLRYNLREATLDYDKMLHQIDIQIASLKIALQRALDYKYPTPGYLFRDTFKYAQKVSLNHLTGEAIDTLPIYNTDKKSSKSLLKLNNQYK